MTTIHPHALIALRAARNWRSWGRDAAVRYCRNRAVPVRLYYLARLLDAARTAGV